MPVRILVPRDEADEDVFASMDGGQGAMVVAPAVCRTVRRERHGKRLKRFLFEGRISIATFTSSTAFFTFVDMVGTDALPFLQKVAIAAVGSAAIRAIEEAGLSVTIRAEPATVDAMAEEIVRWAEKRKI